MCLTGVTTVRVVDTTVTATVRRSAFFVAVKTAHWSHFAVWLEWRAAMPALGPFYVAASVVVVVFWRRHNMYLCIRWP